MIYHQQERWEESISLLNESMEIAKMDESSYEIAKTYHLRSISENHINQKKDAQQDQKMALEQIHLIDHCRWTNVIEESIK